MTDTKAREIVSRLRSITTSNAYIMANMTEAADTIESLRSELAGKDAELKMRDDERVAHEAVRKRNAELLLEIQQLQAEVERLKGQKSELTFNDFRKANVTRSIKWHPAGIDSWSTSDWMVAIMGELGEAASLIKMRNRERDGLQGNKFSPTDKQIADEIADVLTYLDLFAEVNGVDLGKAAVEKFNEVSERVGFPDRILINKPSEFKPLEREGV